MSHEVLWPAHGVRRVDGEGLPDQPVEELAGRRSLNLSTARFLIRKRHPTFGIAYLERIRLR